MAQLHQVSSILSTFKNVYDSSWKKMGTSQSDLSTDLKNVSNTLDNAISDFSTASSDAQIGELKACIILAKDGIDRVKSHVDGDLTGLFSNGDEVRSYITEIEKKIEAGKDWKRSGFVEFWDNTVGRLVKEWRSNEGKQIDRANKEIDNLNQKGQDQLNAMSNAINSVEFGVAGNMVHGGSLGSSITYSDNYNFNPTEWDEAHPIYELSTWQEIGCLMVGAVEGVVKVVEGVFDFGTTLVAGVVSWFSKDAGEKVANFAARDLTGEAFGSVFGDAYLQSGGRKLGKTAGSMVAHGALWMTGAGAIVSAVSIAGNTSESILQNTEDKTSGNIWKAFGIGAVVGAASYVGGHLVKAAGQKFSSWITSDKMASTVVGRAYSWTSNAITQPFGAGWSSRTGGIVSKAVNIAASPLRGMGHLMAGGAKFLGKYDAATGEVTSGIFKNSTAWQRMGALDARADAVATNIVNGVTSRVGAVRTRIQNAHAEKAMEDYKAALKEWEDAGRPESGKEWNKLQKAYKKIPDGDYSTSTAIETSESGAGAAEGSESGTKPKGRAGTAEGSESGTKPKGGAGTSEGSESGTKPKGGARTAEGSESGTKPKGEVVAAEGSESGTKPKGGVRTTGDGARTTGDGGTPSGGGRTPSEGAATPTENGLRNNMAADDALRNSNEGALDPTTGRQRAAAVRNGAPTGAESSAFGTSNMSETEYLSRNFKDALTIARNPNASATERAWANDILDRTATTLNAANGSQGSMTADGTMHLPANSLGAPSGSSSSAFDTSSMNEFEYLSRNFNDALEIARNPNASATERAWANDILDRTTTTFNAVNSNQGSMTADGTMHLPANEISAPKGAADSAFSSESSTSDWEFTYRNTHPTGTTGTTAKVNMDYIDTSLTPEGNLRVAHDAWVAADRPTSGEIFDRYQSAYAYDQLSGGATNRGAVQQLHGQSGNINYNTTSFRGSSEELLEHQLDAAQQVLNNSSSTSDKVAWANEVMNKADKITTPTNVSSSNTPVSNSSKASVTSQSNPTVVSTSSTGSKGPHTVYRETLDKWIDNGRPTSGELYDDLIRAYGGIEQSQHELQVFNPKTNVVGSEGASFYDPQFGVLRGSSQIRANYVDAALKWQAAGSPASGSLYDNYITSGQQLVKQFTDSGIRATNNAIRTINSQFGINVSEIPDAMSPI